MKYDFKKLKAARQTRLLTQTELARMTGLSASAINQVEMGIGPWIKAIRRIVAALNSIEGYPKVGDVVLNGQRRAS